MKFVVSSTELMGRLQLLGRVVSNKNPLAILDNFLFRLTGNDLNIVASDLETTLETTLTIGNVQEEGAVAMPAKMLMDSLKDFHEEPITFTVGGANLMIEISWSAGKISIPGSPADDYPEKPQLKQAVSTISMPANTLLNGITGTLYATADDELRPVMNGIYFDITDSHVTMVASDAHKLASYKRTDMKGDGPASFILPKKSAGLLKNILGKMADEVTLTFDDKNAVFVLPGYSMVCRLVEGNYPAYQSVIPTNNTNKITIDRVELLNAVRRVAVFSNQASNLIKLKITGNEMVVSAQDLDFSVSAFQRVNCQYEGDDIEIGFKSTFLCDILANLSSVNVSLELSDPNRAGLILPVEKESEHEDILTLLMPMMIGV